MGADSGRFQIPGGYIYTQVLDSREERLTLSVREEMTGLIVVHGTLHAPPLRNIDTRRLTVAS